MLPGAQDALHCAQEPITHHLLHCVSFFLSLSLALFSLLYLPYPLCVPHLFPSLAPSAMFPLPVRARCKQFAGLLLVPLFLGPTSLPALCSGLILPPRSLCLYAHGAPQCARQPLSHSSALSLPAPAPWVPPVPWSSLSPWLTYPGPPLFGSPRSTLHDTTQKRLLYALHCPYM